MKRSLKIGILQALLLSLLLHLSFESVLWFYNPTPPPAQQIEVQLLEPEKKIMPKLENLKRDQAKQVVEQDKKALNKEIDEKAKYLSQNNQRVEKQTVAQAHGDFQNRDSQSKGESQTPSAQQGSAEASAQVQALKAPSPTTQPAPEPLKKFEPKFDVVKSVRDREEREQEFDRDPEAYKQMMAQQAPPPPPAPAPTEKKEATAGGKGQEVSQTVDYIKDLDPGLETLLSTREFVYYTYYARMRRQLNQFWGPKVKEKLIAIYRSGRQIASASDKITRCLITLDKTGNLVKVQIIGVSGVHELDEAAVEAFRAAAPFPNPPVGMVEDDGTIRIRWDFILEV